jgi:hypothetical protein
MKKILIILLFIPLLNYSQELSIDYYKVSNNNLTMMLNLLDIDNLNNNNFWTFLFDLSVVESNCVWDSYCGSHVGLWQMGESSRLDALKISKKYNDYSLYKFDSQTFINNPIIFEPNIQKKYICYYMIFIQEVMKEYINKYHETTINNIYITKSGIIAASHLVGVKSVMDYLDSNGKIISSDANNTSLEKYLMLFWNYEF